MKKKFKKPADEILRMIPDIGFAFATDKITVEGNKVDYMVREASNRDGDSGWIFYGGGETQEYLDDPNNTSVFNLNTICNYDPEIIPFLTFPPGTEIERNLEGKLELLTKGIEKPSVFFLYPVEAGKIVVTSAWEFYLRSRMLRRIDDSSLVIWKPGFTIWLNAYTSNNNDVAERIDSILQIISAEAYGLEQEGSADFTKLKYYLVERADGKQQASANLFGFTKAHEIHMSIYYDGDEFLPEIDLIWSTLTEIDAQQEKCT
jgi:hypothetical protein